MAEWSRRASRAGVANAVFVVAAAERLPAELRGVADELTITFPWGSLLRGALALDDAASSGIASLVAPGGVATVVVSIEGRDGLDLPRLDAEGACEALAERWAIHGIQVCDARPINPADLRSLRSTWARRLAAGGDRAAWRLELRRSGPGPRDGVWPRR